MLGAGVKDWIFGEIRARIRVWRGECSEVAAAVGFREGDGWGEAMAEGGFVAVVEEGRGRGEAAEEGDLGRVHGGG